MPVTNEHKTYEHLNVVDRDGVELIEKVVTDAERLVFDELPLDAEYVLRPVEIIDRMAYYQLCLEGNIIGKPKDTWLAAVRAAARLSCVRPTTRLKRELPRRTAADILLRVHEVEQFAASHPVCVPEVALNFIKSTVEHIDFDESVCHDDLIALNILANNGAVKIIDWEHTKIGYRESDIGRLLYDLHFDDPQSGKYYYPGEWRDELIDAYIAEVRNHIPEYNASLAKHRIRFAGMVNYLGPIRAVLRTGDIQSQWLKANIDAFNSSC